ncbi:group II intron maturase-specific domain-containing protein [Streptomyces sp. NPDC006267]
MTKRTSQQDPGTVLSRTNQILRGWVNYFKGLPRINTSV